MRFSSVCRTQLLRSKNLFHGEIEVEASALVRGSEASMPAQFKVVESSYIPYRSRGVVKRDNSVEDNDESALTYLI